MSIAKVGDINIEYYVEGDGAPLLMVHGFGLSAHSWGEPFLNELRPHVQIIRFSNHASQLGPHPVPATPDNIRKGLEYVKALHGGGGTMMIEGIKAALDFDHDPSRLRLVSFMTDGYIGNEVQILGEVHKRLGASRIFSFGVGSSVNRFLLDRHALATVVP